ncbi:MULTISPECIES: BA14K family protein [unclassified Ensifer]|uniref:BA14K family protein n=1 Tax=unclassified Ensifer TaxID=2633371 RepID=UPI000813175E|nr:MULTISPECIES: BA14K family protein [unclassified Ensifer]OCP20971.1 hypothetical protein BC363_29185 [Ensifer sp. LC384]OCP21212.1 hypothetical protein BC361_27105 [Ensifer sp. LC54]OCP34571.1 hypothetical protein BC360_10770 [Ensifer sp. LC163]
MTGFRNFVVGCALAAASLMTSAGPAPAMPLAGRDVQIKAQGDVQNAQYYPYRRYGGVRYPNDWGGGWGPGYGPGYGGGWGSYYRPGFSFYFGPSYGGYYNNYYQRRYYQRRYYDDYYPRRYYRERYYYRDNYVRRGTSSHVSWCFSRYRSYNPATNRFLTYQGVYRVCYSPYR